MNNSFTIGDKVFFTDPLDGENFFGTITRIDSQTNRVSVKWDQGGTERLNPSILRKV